MKIYSKFQDYYDSAMAYGVDDHVRWVRNTHEIPIKAPTRTWYGYDADETVHPFFQSEMFRQQPKVTRHHSLDVTMKWFYIGFCGRVYATLRMHWYSRLRYDQYEHTHFAYDADDVVKFLDQYDHKKDASKLFVDPPSERNHEQRHRFTHDDYDKYFRQFQGTDMTQLFVDHDTPIFVIEVDRPLGTPATYIDTAPQLKNFDFARIMDPFTAYQEIEMFMSGVLGTGNPPMVEIDDKHRITGHGFNECSFRKPPTKRKGKCNQ